ncbi:MAG: ComEC/Rec2 family competence protein [Chloroflexia bacterium]
MEDRIRLERIPRGYRWAAVAVLFVLSWAAYRGRPDGRLHLYFLPVGQGNGILVVSPRGHTLLIDGGPDGKALVAALGRRLPFWERELDWVLLTETTPAQMAGPVAALERYRALGAGRPGRARPGPGWQRWLELLAHQGVEPVPLGRGARIALEDGVLLEVLFPGPQPLEGVDPGARNDSLVLRLSYGAFRALIAGAAGPAAQQRLLLLEPDLGSAVLLVPRQAGNRALDGRFLQAVHPALAIVSAGTGYHEGPDARTLDQIRSAGIPCYRTDREGTIEVRTDGSRLDIRSDRRPWQTFALAAAPECR